MAKVDPWGYVNRGILVIAAPVWIPFVLLWWMFYGLGRLASWVFRLDPPVERPDDGGW